MKQQLKPQQLRLVLQLGSALLLLLFTLPLILPGEASIGLWLMQAVPLFLVLRRLHKYESRPLQWLGFLVLFYFTVGVLQIFTPSTTERWLGSLTVLCCCLLFPLAIVQLRVLRHYKE